MWILYIYRVQGGEIQVRLEQDGQSFEDCKVDTIDETAVLLEGIPLEGPEELLAPLPAIRYAGVSNLIWEIEHWLLQAYMGEARSVLPRSGIEECRTVQAHLTAKKAYVDLCGDHHWNSQEILLIMSLEASAEIVGVLEALERLACSTAGAGYGGMLGSWLMQAFLAGRKRPRIPGLREKAQGMTRETEASIDATLSRLCKGAGIDYFSDVAVDFDMTAFNNEGETSIVLALVVEGKPKLFYGIVG